MHDINDWQHHHDFTDASQRNAARRTYWVIALTAATMVVELVAGFWTGSMALLADGWHMATHVDALAIAAFAYYLTQRYAHDPQFTFGTRKKDLKHITIEVNHCTPDVCPEISRAF